VAYHSAKRVTNDLAFNQTMQKKSILPRNQNEVDLMQLTIASMCSPLRAVWWSTQVKGPVTLAMASMCSPGEL